MFYDRDIKANDLPRRTLCFTFNDGGNGVANGKESSSLALGRYLYEELVPATFFVVGADNEEGCRHQLLIKVAAQGQGTRLFAVCNAVPPVVKREAQRPPRQIVCLDIPVVKHRAPLSSAGLQIIT